MIENNNVVVGSKKVAGVLNRYYISKVRKMRENMNKQTEDPMIKYRKYVKKPKYELVIKEVTMSEINKIYKSLNNSNTTSLDNISMKTLNKTKKKVNSIINTALSKYGNQKWDISKYTKN